MDNEPVRTEDLLVLRCPVVAVGQLRLVAPGSVADGSLRADFIRSNEVSLP
jgi:hypothetical protein